ncbi:MAG: protein phosphatase 2C domain-containing protein, partial [Ktedonobacteraceae bacterium]
RIQVPEVLCPNCHQPVHLNDPLCQHCRYPLSPSASGLNVRLAGSGPLSASAPLPVAPMRSPAPPAGPSVSDLPTVQLPLNFAAGGEQKGGEITMKHHKPLQPEATTYGLSPMRGRNLSLTVGTRSDPGLKRKHKPNEDSLLAMQGTRTHDSQLQQFGLFVVADGMGGHANGQDASRQAIQTMIDYLLPRISSNTPMDDDAFQQLLGDGVQNANLAVHNRNLEVHADMGTTMTAALVVGATAYVANVGDSRTYLYRQEQGLRKVTIDHSVVASLVEAGIIQPDDIYTHPKRNQIYRSLGEKPVVEVDTFKEEMQPGDKLLLCSDGLWDMTRDPVIQQILSKPTSDPNKTGQDLIKVALQGGGEDNVTVIVVQFSEMNAPAGTTGVQLLAKPDTVTVPNLPSF